VFLHAVREGPANRSYGLQVAQLAGVPRSVIANARAYLEGLEAERDRSRLASADGGASSQAQLPLYPPDERARAAQLRAALEAVQPDELTPRAALEALYKLKGLL
jgi:DNA mismatch repair protein MutS